MKTILLISDTHGNINPINTLVEKVNADMVIHAGDFGFYDDKSLFRLSQRELKLLVTHSPYRAEYKVDEHTDKELLREIVKKHRLHGTFQDYLTGDKVFSVPVYTVWGNHEDPELLKLMKKNGCPKNLFLLDSDNHYELDEMTLCGLGGNFLVSKKLLRQPIAGQAGKVFATLHEFGCLYLRIKESRKPRMFISHVSPGKEPLLTRLIMHFMPTFWVSGHMGAPYNCVWNQFTIREVQDSIAWLNSEVEAFKEVINGANLTMEAKIAADLILQQIDKDDAWFKRLWNVNLTDFHEGYAVLKIEDGRFSLETYSLGIYCAAT